MKNIEYVPENNYNNLIILRKEFLISEGKSIGMAESEDK